MERKDKNGAKGAGKTTFLLCARSSWTHFYFFSSIDLCICTIDIWLHDMKIDTMNIWQLFFNPLQFSLAIDILADTYKG